MDDKRILEFFQQHPQRVVHLDELGDHLGLPEKKRKDLKRQLKSLVDQRILERQAGRQFRLSRAGQQLEGRVAVDHRGQPTVVLDGERSKDALLVVPEQSDRVQHNDRVLIQIVARGRTGRHFANIVTVMERPSARHVGLFRQIGRAAFVELEISLSDLGLTGPGLKRNFCEVRIDPKDAQGAQDRQLVEVELYPVPRGADVLPTGRVLRILGEAGSRSAELMRLMIEHNLDRPFPEEAATEAEAFGSEPTDADRAGRRDVRQVPLVTIDGETARDFDDAVCAVREGDHYRVYVAVADVSHYVRFGSALDSEAYRRGTSTYLTDRAIPMLPEALSNGLCSLNPAVDRLCMLADMTVDESGHVTSATFHRAVMRSHARLTYTRVAKALEGEPDEECQRLLPMLLILAKVAHKLLERRLKRGAIDLDLPEPQIEFNSEGLPKTVTRRPRNDAHRLIEDLMLTANEAAARFFLEQDLPTLYRVHEDPDPDKLANFAGLCERLGVQVSLPERPQPKDVSRILEALNAHEQGKALHGLLLRSMSQARYDAEPKGHYGLASEAYLHFTSPIRRYPDLIVHRLMKGILNGESSRYTFGSLQEVATASSAAERRAMIAERQSMDLDRALIAKDLIGLVRPATITGLAGFGIFAALDDPYLEGMVPVQALPEDFYEMDEFGAMLVGQRSGRMYALGDKVTAEIASVNVARRRVELRLLSAAETGAPEPPRRPAAPRKAYFEPRRGQERPKRGNKPSKPKKR